MVPETVGLRNLSERMYQIALGAADIMEEEIPTGVLLSDMAPRHKKMWFTATGYRKVLAECYKEMTDSIDNTMEIVDSMKGL